MGTEVTGPASDPGLIIHPDIYIVSSLEPTASMKEKLASCSQNLHIPDTQGSIPLWFLCSERWAMFGKVEIGTSQVELEEFPGWCSTLAFR